MGEMYFNKAVYEAKKNFIMQCLAERCIDCKLWSGKKCTHPHYITEHLLSEIPVRKTDIERLKANHISCGFDHANGRFRIRLTNTELGNKTAALLRSEDEAEIVAKFIQEWPEYVDTEEKYICLKNELNKFRKELKKNETIVD